MPSDRVLFIALLFIVIILVLLTTNLDTLFPTPTPQQFITGMNIT